MYKLHVNAILVHQFFLYYLVSINVVCNRPALLNSVHINLSQRCIYFFPLGKSKVQCKVQASIGTLPNVLYFTFHPEMHSHTFPTFKEKMVNKPFDATLRYLLDSAAVFS